MELSEKLSQTDDLLNAFELILDASDQSIFSSLKSLRINQAIELSDGE